jgi:hypothetical protein
MAKTKSGVMAEPLATGAGRTLARGLIYEATVGCKSSSAFLEARNSHRVLGDSTGHRPKLHRRDQSHKPDPKSTGLGQYPQAEAYRWGLLVVNPCSVAWQARVKATIRWSTAELSHKRQTTRLPPGSLRSHFLVDK